MPDLRDELGADPPAALLAALDAGEQDRLAAALRDARTSQSAALDQALTGSLQHVPFFARGAIKKLVFG